MRHIVGLNKDHIEGRFLEIMVRGEEFTASTGGLSDRSLCFWNIFGSGLVAPCTRNVSDARVRGAVSLSNTITIHYNHTHTQLSCCDAIAMSGVRTVTISRSGGGIPAMPPGVLADGESGVPSDGGVPARPVVIPFREWSICA